MTTENWIDLNDMQAVAIAQSEGWEIEVFVNNEWNNWHAGIWRSDREYRGRPRQPKMKEVKLECWLVSGRIEFLQEQTYKSGPSWKRQPHLDMIAKVPE